MPTTVLSYEGVDYILDAHKNASSLVFFVGESPKPTEVETFVKHLYGENTKAVSNPENRIINVPSQQIPPEIPDIRFEQRQEFEKLVFPDLPKLERSDNELQELVEGNKDKLSEKYKVQLILRAEAVLNACFEKKIQLRVPVLIHELDTYRSLCRDFRPKARQRIKQQVELEKIVNQVVEENKLDL